MLPYNHIEYFMKTMNAPSDTDIINTESFSLFRIKISMVLIDSIHNIEIW